MGLVAVDQVILEVAAQLEGQPRDGGVTLHTDVPEDMIPIESDHVLLKQILINLASNAIRFTHAGSVVLGAESDPETGQPLRVFVRDTGIGIPKDRLEAIFEPFEQASATTHRAYGGTGLGLSICQAICDALGYRISVESQVGKGSTFTVHLASHVSDRDRAVPIPDTATSARQSSQPRETQRR
jgi:signal transduction histidine kinase